MRVIATENIDRPDELIDITIEIGDGAVSFTYPLSLVNVDKDGNTTLELGVDEIKYLD